ncbi:MAG: rhodanese-like domain-containing protein [Cyanothece sp. SIO2G6]|nr:rhodanese-like domain-containing protein [Cyanothece sp. SIO2G6]
MALLWVNLVACGSLNAAARPTIAPQTLLQQINTNTAPLVLDVRTADEFAAGHVPSAVNIPIQALDERFGELRAIAKSDPIVVYCERGVRANRAKTMLNEAEFGTILHLAGDMQQWRRNDFPVDFPK